MDNVRGEMANDGSACGKEITLKTRHCEGVASTVSAIWR